MNKKLVWLLTLLLLGASTFADAQHAGKTPRIGYLGAASSPSPAFMQGLSDLGYAKARTLTLCFARMKVSQNAMPISPLSWSVSTLMSLWWGGNTAIRAAKKTTSTIPIVMLSVGDPVGLGLVASLARPGGNITGLSQMSPDLTGKRVELLKEILPKVKRVAFIWDPDNPGMTLRFKEAQAAAAAAGIVLQSLEVRRSNELTTAFAAAAKEHTEALVVPAPMARYERKIADFATTNRLPWTCDTTESVVRAGCLMAYGPSYPDLHRRAAAYVDKILKGIKPADLPVEQPMKFEFVVNLKTAKQIGLTIPPNVLARADKVIK